MRVLRLQADNFKNLKAVEITPAGDVVVIGGRNEQGKSSVLDAIWVALKGRSVAPPKPIRKGEEECRFALDLGELLITRKFTAKDDGTYTDSVKVESAEGLRYSKPQEVLDALLGQIGFDPFGFVRMKPEQQAETLLQMVPLKVDLDELAEADQSDYQNRRDVNRDAAQLRAQIDAIPREEVPTDAPDREALVARLGEAAEKNSAIERERLTREGIARNIAGMRESAASKSSNAANKRAEAEQLLRDAEAIEKDAAQIATEAEKAQTELEALPPLDEPVDVDEARRELSEAEAVLASVDRQKRRRELELRCAALVSKSEAYTAAMDKREKERNDALAAAKMPIESLAFGLDEKGRPVVNLNGVPFEQASTAEKLKASVAIAMEANPELRVLRISDGSLLDEDSLALLRGMAETDDFQLWVEVVGDPGSVGIVMENGEVRAAPAEATAEPKVKAKPAKAAKPAGERTLV